MNTSDKVKMEINIAGEHLSVTVPFDRQNAVRDTERHVASMFSTLRSKFQKKSDQEILAMVAYQCAFDYDELQELYDKAVNAAKLLEEDLDNDFKGFGS